MERSIYVNAYCGKLLYCILTAKQLIHNKRFVNKLYKTICFVETYNINFKCFAFFKTILRRKRNENAK